MECQSRSNNLPTFKLHTDFSGNHRVLDFMVINGKSRGLLKKT